MVEQLTNGLQAAEERRHRLRGLMDRLEAALAQPARADVGAWHGRVSELAGELDAELRSHVLDTEGPGGLYEELATTVPRLAGQVERLGAEHPVLWEQLANLRSAVEVGDDVEAVRNAGLELLTALILHRQHGADLLYEAYWVDVGGPA